MRPPDRALNRCLLGLVNFALLVAAIAWSTAAAAQYLPLGADIYQRACVSCHGEIYAPYGPISEEPGVIPAFYVGNAYLPRIPPSALSAAILLGVTGTGMNGLGGSLSNEELESLIAYIESFR